MGHEKKKKFIFNINYQTVFIDILTQCECTIKRTLHIQIKIKETKTKGLGS